MGKLRVLSGHEICKILESQGFVPVRQRGDHLMMQKKMEVDGEETTFTVPVPLHREVAIGTLASIIRQSGLPRELFEVS